MPASHGAIIMNRVVVLDYGSSNLRSVLKAMQYVAGTAQGITLSADPETILAADRIVFPGQGAIKQCMSSLSDRGLVEVLLECIRNKPFLGICLGLQCLMDSSDEDGGTKGLGIIPGGVRRFPDGVRDAGGDFMKVPHMGWNNVSFPMAHPLWKDIEPDSRFYFVHSYYVKPESEAVIAGTTEYIRGFTSALARDNLFAVQFHPEKSQAAGLTLLRNFLEWN